MNKSPVRFIDKDKNNRLFFTTLRERVNNYFTDNNISKHYNNQMVIKTIVLISCYVLPFLFLLLVQPSFGISLGLWSLMGFALAGIGMSVMHDANHNAYSANSRVNFWLGHSLNMLGASVFNWKLQHNLLHHTYTNVVSLDDDVEDKLVMRFSPHTKTKWYHKFQFVYAFFFYGILTIYWVFLKDFVQFNRYTREGVNKLSKKENKKVMAKIAATKLIYAVVFFVIPLGVLKMSVGQFIVGYFLMHFIAGIVLTTIFQLAHTVEETSHPLPNKNNTIENDWAIHQLNTTVNFSRGNKFISWYLGGLNFQVEHHLFPAICHVHYPKIAPIVKATAEEYGIPYLENKTFGLALRSHVRTLKRFGEMPSLNDAIA
jgi:linoleoyl-CoA desaturase